MKLQSAANHFLQTNSFRNIVVWAIISCSILLGIETYYPASNRLFISFDVFFSLFFLVELVVRVVASGNLFRFFGLFKRVKTEDGYYQLRIDEIGFWNWFDFLIVLFTTISLFKHIVEHPEFLIVSRLFRILRIFRLLEVSNELKNVEKRIISIIPTVFSFVLLLGILIYIYSIIGVYLFEHKDFGMADFSTLPGALMTLFQLMTLDGWTEVMNATSSTIYQEWLVKGYFISFVIFTAIISFNIFVAVLTSQVHEKMIAETVKLKADRKKKNKVAAEGSNQYTQSQMDLVLNELKELRKEVAELRNTK